MKKILLSVITLFVMAAAAFGLDVKDFAKKVETFYKSGSYIKSVYFEYDDNDKLYESAYYYIPKQHISSIYFEDYKVVISTVDENSIRIFDEYDDSKILKTYLQDGNLIIEWCEE